MAVEWIYNQTMKKILGTVFIVLLMVVAGHAQNTAVKQVPAKPTASIDGKSLFHEYCAVCHGADAKGGGPAAKALNAAPGDLTQVSRKNAGKFPEERILRILKGDEKVAAHGSQEMPIWGKVFNNMGSLTMGQTRIHALLQYVEGLQAK